MSSITDVVSDFVKNLPGFVLFMTVVIASLIASYVGMTKILDVLEQRKSVLSKYKKTFRIFQAILFSLSIILIIDILLQNAFYTSNLIAIMIVSYGSCALISLFFSIKLLSWFKENKNTYSLLFGLTILSIFINNLISILLFTFILTEKPFQIDYSTPIVFNFECSENTLYCFLKQNIINIQSYTVIAYYSFFWLSNLFLLNYHKRRIGRFRFYGLIAIPLVLYFFVFGYNYDDLYSINQEINIDESTIFAIQIFMLSMGTALCGLLYGIGFRSIANLLKISPNTERNLKLASYGTIIFFITAGSTLVGTNIHPFGMASVIFLPVSLIMLYVGVYYSILTISNDIKIKRFIRNSAYKELDIMGNLAQSQMMEGMKARVLSMTKSYSAELHEKDHSEPIESEDELKNYLDEAIKIFKQKNQGEP